MQNSFLFLSMIAYQFFWYLDDRQSVKVNSFSIMYFIDSGTCYPTTSYIRAMGVNSSSGYHFAVKLV